MDWNITFEFRLWLTNGGMHGLRTPRELFFQKSRTFGLEQTFWTEIFWGIWGIFGQNISTHFGTVSSLSMFSIIQPLFLQKTKPLYPTPKYLFGSGIWIWAAKNLRCSLHVSVVRVCIPRSKIFFWLSLSVQVVKYKWWMGVELQLVKRRRSRSTIEIYFEGKCIGIWRSRESNEVCFFEEAFLFLCRCKLIPL